MLIPLYGNGYRQIGERAVTKKPSEEIGSPSSLPQSTPTDYSGHTLSTTIEIYRSLGKIEQAISDLTKQSSDQYKKIDDISKTVHVGKGILIAASIVLSAFGGIIIFFLNKFWDTFAPLIQTAIHH
jgi:hypothetical protein